MVAKKKHSAIKALAYREGFLDACLACADIVLPVANLGDEARACATVDLLAQIFALMLRKHDDE